MWTGTWIQFIYLWIAQLTESEKYLQGPLYKVNSSVDAIFCPCIEYQRGSTELIIFSREVKQIVTVAYPIASGRFRIRPYGFADYLQRRGLFIECFCGILSDMPCSTRIVDSAINGHVLMQCANERCGFRADLTDIYHTSFFTSTYGELPTLVANPQPDMTLIYNAFRCLPPNLHDIAPYFNGYLGSHVSVWPVFGNSVVWLVLPQQTHDHWFDWSISVALYLLKVLLLLLEDQRVTMDANVCPPVPQLDKNRMVWLWWIDSQHMKQASLLTSPVRLVWVLFGIGMGFSKDVTSVEGILWPGCFKCISRTVEHEQSLWDPIVSKNFDALFSCHGVTGWLYTQFERWLLVPWSDAIPGNRTFSDE